MLQVLYIYYIHYCAAEGLCKSHEKAKQVLLYLFYGEYRLMKHGKWTGKNAPVLRAIHNMVTNPRRRLTDKALKTAFDLFIALLDAQPELKKFTHDKGEGQPPSRYLAGIEIGLRNLGLNIHIMGTGAISTKEKWNAVQDHRKREVRIRGSHAYVWSHNISVCFRLTSLLFVC